MLSVCSAEQRGVLEEKVIYKEQNVNTACAMTTYLFGFKMINKFASTRVSVP